MGLQAGGRRFESRTLHLEKALACRTFPLRDAILDNARASAVRADLSVPVRRCRVGSAEVERGQVTNRPETPKVTSSSRFPSRAEVHYILGTSTHAGRPQRAASYQRLLAAQVAGRDHLVAAPKLIPIVDPSHRRPPRYAHSTASGTRVGPTPPVAASHQLWPWPCLLLIGASPPDYRRQTSDDRAVPRSRVAR